MRMEALTAMVVLASTLVASPPEAKSTRPVPACTLVPVICKTPLPGRYVENFHTADAKYLRVQAAYIAAPPIWWSETGAEVTAPTMTIGGEAWPAPESDSDFVKNVAGAAAAFLISSAISAVLMSLLV